MEFLKDILGEELYNQFAEKINAHNGNEANQDKLIKLANLASGEYVGKAKHDALQALLDGKDKELTAANGLIEGFKKSEKGNEELQGKITSYETQVTQLQEQLKETQISAELKVAMLAAGAKKDDIDYLDFKLRSKGEKLELGEDGKVKGIDDMISGLKTQFPNQFEAAKGGFKVDPNPLPAGDDRKAEPTSLADALRMQYESNTN
jgi:hypothetical protein